MGYDQETDFKQLNSQVKELASKLNLIQNNFNNLIGEMVEKMKYAKSTK